MRHVYWGRRHHRKSRFRHHRLLRERFRKRRFRLLRKRRLRRYHRLLRKRRFRRYHRLLRKRRLSGHHRLLRKRSRRNRCGGFRQGWDFHDNFPFKQRRVCLCGYLCSRVRSVPTTSLLSVFILQSFWYCEKKRVTPENPWKDASLAAFNPFAFGFWTGFTSARIKKHSLRPGLKLCVAATAFNLKPV